MLFNSYVFILAFLPFTALAYFLLNRLRLVSASTIFLALASLFYYGWWNPIYVPLIILSIVFNYGAGEALRRLEDGAPARRPLFIFALGFNLSLLGFFKYADFFISNINTLTGAGLGLLKITLPLAISFFTFQKIAFLVDSYRRLPRAGGFLEFTLFALFFPQLIAGPIVHYSEMMPQFSRLKNKAPNPRHICMGLYIFFIGLFKKSVVADSLAQWATAGFDQAPSLSFFEAWGTSLSYTFQLYFDFSGYCDMAMGAALLFNIRLPVNFNSPYKAGDIQDFWRRWHMTLSRFFRDYLYIPLGGNRLGPRREMANIMAVFTLGGLWHGASWTFVAWGAMHGAAMAVHRLWRNAGFRLPYAAGWLVTFMFVNASWVLFRARDFGSAAKVFRGMWGLNGVEVPVALRMRSGFLQAMGADSGWWLAPIGHVGGVIMAPVLALCVAAALSTRNSVELMEDFAPDRLRLALLFGLTWSMLALHRTSEFLYYNF